MVRPMPRKIVQAGGDIGSQLATWRKILGLTSQQVADRAGISRTTVSKLESGETGVSLGAFLRVANSLGILEAVINATDPYETDLGRARSEQILPKRVRQ